MAIVVRLVYVDFTDLLMLNEMIRNPHASLDIIYMYQLLDIGNESKTSAFMMSVQTCVFRL